MAAWVSSDVTANGIRLHYYRTGGAKPPLVLCHGATDDGLCWTRVARALEADYDVIMPDARGHGLSEAPESGYTPTDQAADLAGLITALGLEKPAVGGHSMGASTSLFLAATYPTLPRCAILEDPPLWAPTTQMSDEERRARAARMRADAEEQRAMSRDALLAHIRARRPTWSEDEYGPWADAKLRLSATFSSAPRPAAGPQWLEALPTITCPVLLITGDPEEGAIVTPEAADEAVRRQTRLRVVRLRGAGHNIRREQFDSFLQAVRAFLAET